MPSLSFLVALGITGLAFYVANAGKEEMVKIFAAIVAMLGCSLSMLLAPWTIQALMLIFVMLF